MAETPPIETAISTKLLTRVIVLLIAIWSFVAGIVLVFFHGPSASALGAGVADDPGQRLVGAHLLILVPVYLLIAWRPQQYQSLVWLPFAGQAAVLSAVGYSILIGDIGFGDGILPVAVSAIFMALLGFVWITEQRALAHAKFDAEESLLDGSGDQSAGDEGAERSY